MAQIKDMTMLDGVDRACVLGGDDDVNNVLVRKMSWGGNWKNLRIGILCGFDASPPYWSGSTAWATGSNRVNNIGFVVGASSGSRTFLNDVTDRTCLGFLVGDVSDIGAPSIEVMNWTEDATSGSFYNGNQIHAHGFATGSPMFQNAVSTCRFPIPDLADVRRRRGIHIFTISSSNLAVNQYTLNHYGIDSASVISKNGNLNFTSDDLKAALTSSKYPPSASNVLMDQASSVRTIDYNTASYPLDSVFIGATNGLPFYIFDWYIYRVA